MKTHLCIGGPFAGQQLTWDKLNWDSTDLHGYVQFNSSGGSPRSKGAIARMLKRGEIPTPSMVWIHETVFQDMYKESSNAKAQPDQCVGDWEEE